MISRVSMTECPPTRPASLFLHLVLWSSCRPHPHPPQPMANTYMYHTRIPNFKPITHTWTPPGLFLFSQENYEKLYLCLPNVENLSQPQECGKPIIEGGSLSSTSRSRLFEKPGQWTLDSGLLHHWPPPPDGTRVNNHICHHPLAPRSRAYPHKAAWRRKKNICLKVCFMAREYWKLL
jgi:hypothetical protein